MNSPSLIIFYRFIRVSFTEVSISSFKILSKIPISCLPFLMIFSKRLLSRTYLSLFPDKAIKPFSTKPEVLFSGCKNSEGVVLL